MLCGVPQLRTILSDGNMGAGWRRVSEGVSILLACSRHEGSHSCCVWLVLTCIYGVIFFGFPMLDDALQYSVGSTLKLP